MGADPDRPDRRHLPRRFRGVLGVRGTTTLVAVTVVGLALLVGAGALVAAMRRTLEDGVRSAATTRAEEVAASLASGEQPSLAVADSEEQTVQVLDEGGAVVASSANVAGRGPVARPAPGGTARITLFEDDEFIAASSRAETTAGPLDVVVARSIDDVTESTEVVVRLLAVGAPLLLVVVGATTWLLVGRALRPVDAIRAEVEEISSHELHRRVPDPPGHDEIARLASTMNGMLARLDGAQRRQQRFVSDASHELRSPVAAIRQHAEVALAHPEAYTLDELSRSVLADSRRVERLVDDLLLLARTDEGAAVRRRTEVDLDDLVLTEARRSRERPGPAIDTSGVVPARVVGDPAALARVVANLADNATRHARSLVRWTVAVDGAHVELVVDDDGPGIPAAAREQVLERFVRLDDARDRGRGGTGLGLAIVAEVVAAHGGSVTVEEGSLGGARLRVRLPAPDPPRGEPKGSVAHRS